MAISYRDVRRKTEKKLDEKQDKRTQFRAVVVDSLGNQSGAGDIWANQSQRRVWIMTVGGSQPFQVLCVRLTPVIGLGVIVGYADPLSRTLEVLRTDYEFLGPSNTTGTAYESPSNLDFLPGGRLQLWLDTRLIQSLAIYPNSSGLFVNVTDGDYIYQGERKTFNGQTNIDLSGSQPAGPDEHLYVGLYLDSSNTLATVDGATVATSADAPQPTWPAGAYRLGMVLLNDTQTSFSMADDVVNLKIPWTDEESFGGGWPFTNVLTVDATDPDAAYTNIADAQAAAVSGDLILFDGTLPGNNIILGTGVSIGGWSPKTSILTQTSDANCLTVNNAQAFNFSIAMAINSANDRIGLNLTGDLPRVNNVVIDAVNAGAGACDGIVSAGTGDPILTACDSHGDRYALYVDNASSIVTVDGGHYLGGSADVQVNAGLVNLLMPYLESGVISAFPATRGQWFDTLARVRTASKNIYFNSATTAPVNITERSAAPSSPATEDIYLDDGTNTLTAQPSFRRYTGATWEDIGPAAASESVKGIAEIATQTETDTGTDDSRIVSPAKLANTILIQRAYPNLFYNGQMLIWQRGTSFAAVTDGQYTADGWKWRQPAGSGAFTVSQSSDVPTAAQAGLLANYSLLVDCTTADGSIGSTDLYAIGTRIEGFGWSNLAQNIFTISFWVKSTKTGVFCISVRNSGADRSYVAEYTINATATWEYKTVTVAASPSAGTWNYTTGIGATVEWAIAAGTDYHTTAGAWQTGSFLATSNQVNGADSNTNDFRLALVDIVIGSFDRPFVYESYQQCLARCHRYCYVMDASNNTVSEMIGSKFSTTLVSLNRFPPVVMRIGATLSHNVTGYTAGAPGTTTVALLDFAAGGFATISGALTLSATCSPDALNVALTAGTSWSGAAGNVFTLRLGPSVVMVFSSEL